MSPEEKTVPFSERPEADDATKLEELIAAVRWMAAHREGVSVRATYVSTVDALRKRHYSVEYSDGAPESALVELKRKVERDDGKNYG